MPEWQDYYEILGISPDANQGGIKKAYRENAFIYHPDRMQGLSESVRKRAEEKMKKVIQAYEILGDPQKRKKYHLEWFQKKGGTVTAQQGYQVPKPKPVVDPSVIRFTNVTPKTVRTKSFIIRNEGGPYSEIWFSDPKSWVQVINYTSLSDSDQLPLQVEIKAEGTDWGKTYSEIIRVRLDNEETQVRVELRTRSKPAQKRTYAKRRTYAGPIPQAHVGPVSQPPPPRSQPSPRPKPTPVSPPDSPCWKMSFLGILSIVTLFLICSLLIWVGIYRNKLDKSGDERALKIEQEEEEREFILANLDNWVKRWVQMNLPQAIKLKSYVPSDYGYTCLAKFNRNIWVIAKLPYDIPGEYYSQVYIFYSEDNGHTWEIQWKRPATSFWSSISLEQIKIISEKEIYIRLYVKALTPSQYWMLYTKDKGKTWKIYKDWKPEKIESLRS